MKIVMDQAVYVQKNDIAHLNQSDLPIPASIMMKVFGGEVVIIDDRNRYEFIKFEDEKEIEFFRQIDWMVDYNEVKDLSDEEFIKLAQTIAHEKNTIAKKYNAMSMQERRKHSEMVTQCELLDFKIYSLRDVLWMKQGNLKIQLPKEVIDSENDRSIRKLVKKLFPKKKSE